MPDMQLADAPARPTEVGVRAPVRAEVAYRFALGALLIGSFLVRLFGIGWGIPDYDPGRMPASSYRNSYHIDEDNYLWALTLMRPSQGDFDVRDYHWGTLQHYLIYGALVTAESAGVLPSPWEDAFRQGNIAAIPRIYIVARLVSVIAALIGTLLTVCLGRLFGGRTAGLGAGMAYAIAPIAVVEAHYLTGDIVMSVLVLGGIVAAALALQRSDFRLLVLSGFLLGLAVAAKYSAVYALPALFVSQLSFRFASRKGNRPSAPLAILLLPLLALACGFIAGEPFAILAPGKVLEGLKQASDGNSLPSLWDPGLMWYLFTWHVKNFAKLGLTLPIFVLGIAGMALMLAGITLHLLGSRLSPRLSGRLKAWAGPPILPSLVLLAGAFGLGLSLIENRVVMLRYDQPLVALFAVGAGLAWSRLPALWLRIAVGAIAVVVAGIVTAGQLSLLAGPHTANQMLAWLDSHVKPGQLVAQVWPEYPPLDGGSIKLYRIDPWRPAIPADLHPDYIISDNMNFNPPEQSFQQLLARDYRAVVTFEARPHIGPISWDEGITPHDWKYSHPTFTIYTLK